MTTIRLHTHPLEGEPPQVFEADSIWDWLRGHYGARAPTDRQVHIYAGQPSQASDLTGKAEALARSDAPLYTVLEAPGAPIVPFLINMAISMVISLVAKSLFAPDKTLDETNRTQQSPNNALTQRENRVRMLERVEDIYGTVRSYPSLLMPSYQKYESNRKVEYSLLCIGRGYHDIADVREADTLLADVDGSSAKFYPPFTSPNSGAAQLLIGPDIIGTIVSVHRSTSLEAAVLKAGNQVTLVGALPYLIRGAGPDETLIGGYVPATDRDIIFQRPSERTPNISSLAEAGQVIDFDTGEQNVVFDLASNQLLAQDDGAGTYTFTSSRAGVWRGVVIGSTFTVNDFGSGTANPGPFTVVAVDGDTIQVAEPVVSSFNAEAVQITATVRYAGPRTITSVGSGYMLLDADTWNPASQLFTIDITVGNGLTDWTGWYTLPDPDRTEVWTNVLAVHGMYKDDGGGKQDTSVSYEVQIEQLDADLEPTGVVETITGTLSGGTDNERAETLEHATGWTGPARVRARRTTPYDFDFTGTVVDEITWVDLYAVTPITRPHFGNKTTVYTVTRATAGATAVQGRKLSCHASRRLPIFDGANFSGAFDATGLHVSGTIAATSRIVDILAAVTVDPKIGGRPIEEIDMEQIWSTQQDLDAWNTEAGQFNYTFDQDGTSYEETVLAIADAAFCKAYRQNGMLRLSLDRPQDLPVALFMHRNKKPHAETITRTFANDSDYDGVEMVYMDPDSEVQETIRLPLDGSYTKLKRVEVTGIRSYEQAWLRASREMQRLLYERKSMEVEVTSDARALLPNSRILNVDNTRFRSWDGEIVEQDGLEVRLSRAVEFLPGEFHSIVLQQRDGTPQAIACQEGSDTDRVLLLTPPAEAIVTEPTPEEGIRTTFSFAADIARDAQAWLVDEINPTEGGYFVLRARNYAPEYYAADDAAIPPKDSVINS